MKYEKVHGAEPLLESQLAKVPVIIFAHDEALQLCGLSTAHTDRTPICPTDSAPRSIKTLCNNVLSTSLSRHSLAFLG